MIVSVDPKEFKKLFEDFVKSGKVMFNFLCDGYSLNIQLLAEFTVEYSIPCELVEGPPIVSEASYYITNPIHILKDDIPITLEFADLRVVIVQGNFKYTLLQEFEARKELVLFDRNLCIPLGARRLQYLVSAADKMTCIAKELRTLPVEPMFVNGHFYVRYSDIAFVDRFDFIQDMCIPYTVLRQVVPKLSEDATYIIVDNGEQLIICSEQYVFYIQAVNFNLKGNSTNALDDIILQSKKVSTICLKNIASDLNTIISTLPNQKFTLAVVEDNFNISITSADSTATVFLGKKLDRYILSTIMRSGKLQTLLKLFGNEDSIDVYRAPNVLRFSSGSKNLLISGLIY